MVMKIFDWGNVPFCTWASINGLVQVGDTDGTEHVTHKNIGGKPAHSRVIFFGTPQTDG